MTKLKTASERLLLVAPSEQVQIISIIQGLRPIYSQTSWVASYSEKHAGGYLPAGEGRNLANIV